MAAGGRTVSADCPPTLTTAGVGARSGAGSVTSDRVRNALATWPNASTTPDAGAPTATPPVPSATVLQYPSSAVVTTASTTPSARSRAARASGASEVFAPPV